jgi:hypothetical protein
VKELERTLGPWLNVIKIIQSDNGPEFRNRALKQFCDKWRILQIHGTPRHPRSDGLIEQANWMVERGMESMLALLKTDEWDRTLTQIVCEPQFHVLVVQFCLQLNTTRQVQRTTPCRPSRPSWARSRSRTGTTGQLWSLATA